MSEQNKQVPRLRFPGFTDAWVKHMVKDIFTVTRGNVLATTKTTSIPTDKSIFPVYSSQTKNDGLMGYYDKFLFQNAITWTTDGANAGTVKYRRGKFYSTNVNGVLLGDFANKATAEILNRIAYKFVSKVGNPKLMNNVMAEIEIFLPNFEEQQRISNLLDKLDNLITVNERELNKLKNLKKSYLEKMFPKNGSNIPELRFPGYTDAWVKCELGDVAEIVGGGTPSTSILEYWNGEINWYSPVEIGNQIYVSSSQNKITKLGLEKSSAKILPAYKTILFTSRAGIGNTAIMTTNGATNQGFQSLVIKEKTDLYFLYSISSKIKEMALQIASGSTFLEISGKSLSSLEILVPNFEEQTKIGKFFQHLDNLITVNERELKKLKELKKSYLNDMFV